MNVSREGNLGFDDKLWNAADKSHRAMEAAEDKYVIFVLIFLTSGVRNLVDGKL